MSMSHSLLLNSELNKDGLIEDGYLSKKHRLVRTNGDQMDAVGVAEGQLSFDAKNIQSAVKNDEMLIVTEDPLSDYKTDRLHNDQHSVHQCV